MDYYLMHKNRTLLVFTLEDEVKLCSINKKYSAYLPLPLKKILTFKDAYVESENADILVVNEEGLYLVELWLDDREIPVNRDNKEKYLKGGNSRKFMLENYACSLNDCYWIVPVNKNLLWDDVKLFNLVKVDSIYDIQRQDRYSGVNATLGGQLEKFWYTEKCGSTLKLRLCKKEKYANIIIARELIASAVYRAQGNISYCHYDPEYNTSGELVGCSCDVFTSEELELITAYDLLEEINCTQVDDVYERLIDRAVFYGADQQEVINYLDTQTIVDYLITNRDRHQGNIAFLRDSESLQIVRPVPVFDSGSSRVLERELPEGILVTTVHNLYSTEMECLEHVHDFSVVNVERLLTDEEYREFLVLSNERWSRIEALLNLYLGKITWLRHKQSDTLKDMQIF